jgi:NADH-quinone oxidoreductase subunit G
MNYPEMLGGLSTCRSPQQMFGSVAKEMLPKALKIDKSKLTVVSIMPCTAKKFEARLPKFSKDGVADVDFVLTTSELGRMINSSGIHFKELEAEAFDMPFGFGTGAGLIFGATGGVMEAALRYAAEKLEGKSMHPLEFKQVRGLAKVKEAKLTLAGQELSIAVVHTLAAAKRLLEKIKSGEAKYHFVEVMACPGGCVSGGGQPIRLDSAGRARRADALYRTDKAMQFQKSQDNHTVVQCYEDGLGGKPGCHKAHELLHTHYENRSCVFDARYPVKRGKGASKIDISVDVVPFDNERKGEKVLEQIVAHIEKIGAGEKFDVDAAFSPAASGRIPGSVFIGGKLVDGGLDKALKAIDAKAKEA